MQVTERNFFISCNESVRKGRPPRGETWANPYSVNASLAGPCGSARLRHLSWLQPQQQLPSPVLESQAWGQWGTGTGWGSAVSDGWSLWSQQTPYGGKELSTTEAPTVLGSSPSKICISLPCSTPAALSWHEGSIPEVQQDQEGLPCWRSATSWNAPGPPRPGAPRPPRLCLLHWARPGCGRGTLRTPHGQPQQSPRTEFWLSLGTARLGTAKGAGAKVLLLL